MLLLYKEQIGKAKAKFLENSLLLSSNKSQTLFKIVKDLSNPTCAMNKIPASQELCETLGSFFEEKIDKILSGFTPVADPLQHVPILDTRAHYSGDEERTLEACLVQFPALSFEDFSAIAISVSSGSPLDPLPHRLWKLFHLELFPPLYDICCQSLTSGLIPRCWKKALMSPLLTKATMDPLCPSSYRPISLLPYPIKILEKVVTKALSSFVEDNACLEDAQFGFRPLHGTESALVAVLDDLRTRADSGQTAFLVLLDMSAAFDTVDHKILARRLADIGVVGGARDWIVSYLNDRQQAVTLSPFTSSFRTVRQGVPQGSAISPILFNLYLRPLIALIKSFDISVINYADDTQLVFSFEGYDAISVEQFHSCMAKTVEWMRDNSLQFNGSKTEVLHCSNDRVPRPLPAGFWPATFNNSPVAVEQVRNLGVQLSCNLQLDAHVNKTVSTCRLLLRLLRKILPLLPLSTRPEVVRSIILSRLDYCNALLLGAPGSLLKQLQRIQNMAAKLALARPRAASSSLALCDLHWLPIDRRISFKALCIVFRALQGSGPAALQRKFGWYSPGRSLRSSFAYLTRVPRIKRARMGGRSFSYTAAKLWNGLPLVLRKMDQLTQFKKKAKDLSVP